MSTGNEGRHQRLSGVLYNILSLVTDFYWTENDQYSKFHTLLTVWNVSNFSLSVGFQIDMFLWESAFKKASKLDDFESQTILSLCDFALLGNIWYKRGTVSAIVWDILPSYWKKGSSINWVTCGAKNFRRAWGVSGHLC